jgi:tetratricopeptide (TPR) repeat protein
MPMFRRKYSKQYQSAAHDLSEGKVQEAISKLKEILDKDPQHTNALTTLGVALLQSEGTPEPDSPTTNEAFEYLDKAIASDPKDPVPLFNKAVCLRQIGKREEALTTFEAVLGLEKRFVLAILHMAEISYEMGEWEKAIEYARTAIIRDPGVAGSMTWVKDAMKKAGLLGEDGNPIGPPQDQPRPF